MGACWAGMAAAAKRAGVKIAALRHEATGISFWSWNYCKWCGLLGSRWVALSVCTLRQRHAVGLEISGLEAGPKQVRVDVWLMGCQLLWAGMLQTEAGCDGALHILQESEDRTATVEFLPQNVS